MDQVSLEICTEAIDQVAHNLKDVLETVTNHSMRLEHLCNVLLKKGTFTKEEFDEGWAEYLTWGTPTRYAASELERLGRKPTA